MDSVSDRWLNGFVYVLLFIVYIIYIYIDLLRLIPEMSRILNLFLADRRKLYFIYVLIALCFIIFLEDHQNNVIFYYKSSSFIIIFFFWFKIDSFQYLSVIYWGKTICSSMRDLLVFEYLSISVFGPYTVFRMRSYFGGQLVRMGGFVP